MIVVTRETIAGKRIRKTLGLVRGNTVRARHVGKDILALLRNLVGGEVHEYGKLLAESREQALDRMVSEADALGANAVVATRFTTSMMMGGAAELLAVGTAVVIEDEDWRETERPARRLRRSMTAPTIATENVNVTVPFSRSPCIGERFASTEMALTVAPMMQQLSVELTPGQGKPKLRVLVSLRPKDGLHVVWKSRAACFAPS